MHLKVDVYPLENYTVVPDSAAASDAPRGRNQRGQHGREVKTMKTPREKLLSLRDRCLKEQRVDSVEGVLLVHLHRHPHLLLLKQRAPGDAQRIIPSAATNQPDVTYRLPGGRCRKGEKPEECLVRKLHRHLLGKEKTPPGTSIHSDSIMDVSGTMGNFSPFRVVEVLGRWYRPHLNPLLYPYVPPHISPEAVKEVRTIFLVQMESSIFFQVPHADAELVAVPLFDLYDNTGKYTPDVASLPVALSRAVMNCCTTS